jgi:hypothetical protein
MAGSFIYSQEFFGWSKGAIFQKIVDWLELEDARITIKNDPGRIVAVHGKGWILAWERNAKKTMDYRVEQTSNGVLVSVEVIPSRIYFDDVPTYSKEIVESQSKLLNELWQTFEAGECAVVGSVTLDEMETEAGSKRNSSIHSIVIGSSVFSAGILIVYLSVQQFGYQDNVVGDAYGALIGTFAAIGAVVAVRGVFEYASFRNDVKTISRKKADKKI